MLEYITQLTLWSSKYFQLMPSFVSFLEIYALKKKKGHFKKSVYPKMFDSWFLRQAKNSDL